jgi:hypothetical protein
MKNIISGYGTMDVYTPNALNVNTAMAELELPAGTTHPHESWPDRGQRLTMTMPQPAMMDVTVADNLLNTQNGTSTQITVMLYPKGVYSPDSSLMMPMTQMIASAYSVLYDDSSVSDWTTLSAKYDNTNSLIISTSQTIMESISTMYDTSMEMTVIHIANTDGPCTLLFMAGEGLAAPANTPVQHLVDSVLRELFHASAADGSTVGQTAVMPMSPMEINVHNKINFVAAENPTTTYEEYQLTTNMKIAYNQFIQ